MSTTPVMSGQLASATSKVGCILRENALGLTLLGAFLASVVGQVAFGWAAYNEQLQLYGNAAVGLGRYLLSGHFIEALFENWESEFLQMGLFVWLSALLVQKGSAESKPLERPAESDADPRERQQDPDAPWPVRRGGWVLWLYERSLAIAFLTLFVASLVLHAWGGQQLENEQRAEHGLPPLGLAQFVGSSQFWFESFQNWQSEFLAIFAIVTLTIFLRQRGSPQSKPVASPHAETGA